MGTYLYTFLRLKIRINFETKSINIDMEHEYRDLLAWYNEYCQQHPYFKYSFAFVEGLYQELQKRQQSTNLLTYQIDLWFKDMDQIKDQVHSLRNMIRDNLGQEPDSGSRQSLLNIKRQLVKWIDTDIAQLYKPDVQYVGNKGVYVKDYCLQGEAREKMAYNIYLNRRYLNKIYDYFIACNEFNYLITHLPDGHQGVLRNSSHDLSLIMSQDEWDGELHY